jgi:hypothetical protein
METVEQDAGMSGALGSLFERSPPNNVMPNPPCRADFGPSIINNSDEHSDHIEDILSSPFFHSSLIDDAEVSSNRLAWGACRRAHRPSPGVHRL